MKNSTKILWIGFLSILVLLITVVLILEAETHFIKHATDDWLYDNYNHYLPCEKLPTLLEVEETMQQNQDTLRRIEEVSPGNVMLSLYRYADDCNGKADILIQYPSHEIRLTIEQILGGKTFFGIPCRWRNW